MQFKFTLQQMIGLLLGGKQAHSHSTQPRIQCTTCERKLRSYVVTKRIQSKLSAKETPTQHSAKQIAISFSKNKWSVNKSIKFWYLFRDTQFSLLKCHKDMHSRFHSEIDKNCCILNCKFLGDSQELRHMILVFHLVAFEDLW